MSDNVKSGANAYALRLGEIKNKYRKQLGETLDKINEDLLVRFNEILGDEYVGLVLKRKRLSEKYKALLEDAFGCAEPGYGQEYVGAISKYADDLKKSDSEKDEKIASLLDSFLRLLKPDYPVLVGDIRAVEDEFHRVDEKMAEIVKTKPSIYPGLKIPSF